MRINQEVGCIYDTLAFLSLFTVDRTNGSSDAIVAESSAYYRACCETVQSKTLISRFLYPFFNREQGASSLLHGIFFDREYKKCTLDRLRNTLSNRQYMKSRFISYHFPDADEQEVNKLLRMDNPDVIDVLIRRSMDCVEGSYFFYTLMNFDNIIKTLVETVLEVYNQIDNLRRSVLPNTTEAALADDSVFIKLKAITNAQGVNKSDFTVSVSLIESDLLTFHPDERDFVLLGHNFEKRLATDYEYCDITLYSFAQAISSNPAKYDIFTALLAQSPMTSAELSKQLQLSRPTLDYNLNELVKSRLIRSVPINKRTNNYSLNTDYLKSVTRQLHALTLETTNNSEVR